MCFKSKYKKQTHLDKLYFHGFYIQFFKEGCNLTVNMEIHWHIFFLTSTLKHTNTHTHTHTHTHTQTRSNGSMSEHFPLQTNTNSETFLHNPDETPGPESKRTRSLCRWNFKQSKQKASFSVLVWEKSLWILFHPLHYGFIGMDTAAVSYVNSNVNPEKRGDAFSRYLWNIRRDTCNNMWHYKRTKHKIYTWKKWRMIIWKVCAKSHNH